MARKPKAASSNEFAISAEQVLAVLDGAPAPVRRGRKPNAAALPELPAMTDSDDAGGTDTAGATPNVATMEDAPVRRRPGRPRKQAAEPSSSPQEDAGGQPEPDAGQPDALTTPAPVGGDAMIAEMAYPVSGDAGGDAAPPPNDQDTAHPAQPAAHWDRATDTVRFEWAEIERTAAQSGPNQAMAKLLVAARAEGANSRWPL